MEKRIFAISDPHAFFEETIRDLTADGFDPLNDNHLLIVCGDLFDRGPDSVKIFKWLYNLTRRGNCVVVKGNHDKFLQDFLEGSDSPFNYLHNGLRTTIADFTHGFSSFELWCELEKEGELSVDAFAEWAAICRKMIMEEYPDLLPWLKSLPDYYETENYIFVHGAIDTEAEDWHNPDYQYRFLSGWDALAFDDGTFFGEKIENTDKTVVIGHFGTRYLRDMYPEMYLKREDEDKDDMLVRADGRVVALDATTAVSHRVNVYIIDEELLGSDE